MTRQIGKALCGGLVGFGFASLHHAYYARSNQAPEKLLTHVLSEPAAAAFGGAVLFADFSATCNRTEGNA
jgi:hypothetical protein